LPIYNEIAGTCVKLGHSAARGAFDAPGRLGKLVVIPVGGDLRRARPPENWLPTTLDFAPGDARPGRGIVPNGRCLSVIVRLPTRISASLLRAC
jgi:hypothetical protein